MVSVRGPATSRIADRARRLLRGDAGFSLIEAVLAMVIFLIVATAIAAVLTSGVNSHKLARERTIAQEHAVEKMEEIRALDYDDIGLISGNPPGTVQAVSTINVQGLKATLTVLISYVDDPTAYSYATAANYKRVTVTVTRNSDGKQLAREVTYAAPPARAPYGGIGYSIVNAQVVDFALNTPETGLTVTLGTGPSAPRSDTTDSTGTVNFAALDPNPVSGPTAYYDLTISPPAGYQVLVDDVPPGAAAYVQLAPGQTFNTVLRIYKPATIDVAIERSDGSPYSGNATVTVSSSRGSETFSYSGTTLALDSINGELIVPGLEYTVSATTTGGLVPTPVTQYVPDDYPTDLSSDFTLALPPEGNLAVTVLQSGLPAADATVTVTGGPGSASLSGTTDGSGVVTFSDVAAGSGYTVAATKEGASASLSDQTVNAGGPTSITITLPPPPGTLTATVTWAGAAVSGATVTLTGGPESINVSGATDANGVVTFIYVPAGSGYTVTATKSGQSATATDQTVDSGGTTNVALALPTGSVAVTVTWGANPAPSATVTLSGGPQAINVSGTSDSNGVVTFINVPAGTGYTVTATKAGKSASTTASVTGGSTTNVGLALPTSHLTVRVRRDFNNLANATVVVTGGPNGVNFTGTTNSSGIVTFFSLPEGSGYTVKAYRCDVSSPRSRSITQTVNASDTSVTIDVNSGTCPI